MDSMKKHHTNCLRLRISKISYSALYFPPTALNQRHSYLLKKPSSLLQSCRSLRVGTNTLPAEDSTGRLVALVGITCGTPERAVEGGSGEFLRLGSRRHA